VRLLFKIWETIILPVVLYGSVTIMEVVRVSGNTMMRMLRHKREEMARDGSCMMHAWET
jgi:hypothetical protein